MIKGFRAHIFSLLAAVLLSSSAAIAAPIDFLVCRNNPDNLSQVLTRLIGFSNAFSQEFSPTLTVTVSSYPSAYIYGDRITISQGLLNLTSIDSELAFVLAHEISHKMLGHQHDSSFLGSSQAVKDEREADRLAIALMHSSGFDAGAGVTVLTRIAQKLSKGNSTLSEELELRAATIRNYL